MRYELGIGESLKKIFGGVLIGDLDIDGNPNASLIASTARLNYNRFTANFPSNIFTDEYAIFYEILMTQKINIFSPAQLATIISNNRDLILDSPYVDLTQWERLNNGNQLTDDEKIEAVQANMKDILKELSNMYVSTEEFNSSCIIYIDYFKNQYMLNTGHNLVRIMSDEGYDEKKPGRRTAKYSGFEDAKKYFNESA